MGAIEMFRGNSKTWTLTVTNNSVPVDITSVDLYFTAKTSEDTTTQVFQKTVGAGITITDGVGGIASVKLEPTDTTGIPSRVTKLLYDIEYDNGTDIYTIDKGTLTIKPDITVR
jgi:hypothetical protein